MSRVPLPGWLGKVFGTPVPETLRGELAGGEHVLAAAPVETGGYLAVTALGLWVPDDGGDCGVRRIGWHLVSKAVWQDGTLTVTEAEVTESAGEAVLLTDRAPARHTPTKPGKLPYLVRQRVEGSIRSRYHKELPGGGAWFVVRKLPGTDGIVLQVRPETGTDPEVVRDIAAEAASRLENGHA